jgi:hypothetical protein
METLKMYITNLFQNLPTTNEVIKAKEELLSMMEDKYNQLKTEGKSENEAIGIVISEFGNIDELKEELGLNNTKNSSHNSNVNKVNLEKETSLSIIDVKTFLDYNSKFAIKTAIGVVLCILSVVPLIILNGLFKSSAAEAIGVILMLINVAIAVAIFINSGLKHEKYNFIKKDKLKLDHEVTKYVKDLMESYRKTFSLQISIGVVLCIFSIVPVIIVELFNKSYENIGAGLLFVIVSIAVSFFITAGVRMDGYKQILQEESYSPQMKKSNENVNKLASIYWPLVVATYLIFSFATMKWYISWLIFPVAGMIFAAISGIFATSTDEQKNK